MHESIGHGVEQVNRRIETFAQEYEKVCFLTRDRKRARYSKVRRSASW